MKFLFVSILTYVLAILLIKLTKQHNFLLNYTGEKHQKYTLSKSIPLVGGGILFITVIFFLEFEFLVKLFFISIFLLGILSDLKILKSPGKRLVIQFILVVFFLYIIDLHLVTTKFKILDFLLANIYFSYIFTAFCLLILINGTNFIDGNNANVLGYYLIISLVLLYLNKHENFLVNLDNIVAFIIILLILLIFNLKNKMFLGDNGSFLLASIFGFILIKVYIFNFPKLSSFFIILLLWYPAFENLFSIVRKFYFSKSPANPDNNHLHQLLYYYFLKKFNWKQTIANNSVGIIINFYNFIILLVGTYKYHHTQFMIFLLFINIVVYVQIYLALLKFKQSTRK